jgi:hypothetical protein
MEEIKQLNKKQLLKILAILALSDGHIYKHNGKPKNIRLVTSNFGEAQHELFRYLCIQLFRKKTRTRNLLKKNTNQRYIISDLNYTEGIAKLYKLSPEFNTTPGRKSKKEFLNSPQPSLKFVFEDCDLLKWIALRTYFDFDGSISPSIKLKEKKDKRGDKIYNYFQVQLECEIKISETNPSLVNDLTKLCQYLGIKAIIKKDKRNWSKISGICVSELRSVKKFLDNGGPITNVKISGKSNRFKNMVKKELCKKLRLLFTEDFKFSKSFKTKKEALNYKNKLIKSILKLRN